jgi:predicted DNA-binding transcriptional regulator AlpA
MVKAGNLPQPIKFGGSTYWHKSEIVEIINGLRPAA